MNRLLDRTFKYVPAAATDVRKTFARVRRELKAAQDARALASAEVAEKVKPIGIAERKR